MERLSIRSYRQGDETQILALHNRIFGQRRTLAHWNWQYRTLPAAPPVIKVACAGTEIIAHFAIIPFKTFYQKKSVFSGKAEAAMIQPEYRFLAARYRLFNLIVASATKDAFGRGINLLWGLTNKTSDFLNAGFSFAGQVQNLSRDADMRTAVVTLTKALLKGGNRSAPLSLLLALCGERFQYRRLTAEPAMEIVKPEETAVPKLPETALFPPPDDRITLVRDRDFIQRRFLCNPFIRPQLYLCGNGAGISGYMAVAVEMGTKPRAYIVDFATGSRQPHTVVAALLKRVMSDLESLGIKKTCVWNTFTRKPDPFSRLGLVLPSHANDLVVKCNPRYFDPDFIVDVKNWALTMAFTEGRNG